MNGQPQMILFWVRPDFYEYPGGDSVQALQMRDCLEELGHKVVISADPATDLTPFAWVQLWHLERIHDTYLYFSLARRAGKKIALVDTYWPPDGKPLRGWRKTIPASCRENLKLLARLLLGAGKRSYIAHALRKGWLGARNEMLHNADLHIVNSESEQAVLSVEAGKKLPALVIHNIADIPPPEAASGEVCGYAVCCGHFCPRKNQLTLLRALEDTPHQVCFIGGPRQAQKRYYRKCLRLAGRGNHFISGKIGREEALGFLKNAGVHICASTLETPGLANLEAAALGCALVLPRVSPVMEYFPEEDGPVFYYDAIPGESFLHALENALNAPVNPAWAARMRSQYSRNTMREELGQLCSFMACTAAGSELY